MAPLLNRRDLLLRGVAAAIAAVGAGGFPSALYAAAAVTLDEFLALSKTLTQAGELDPEIANKLLGGFLATGHGDGLAGLVAGGPRASLRMPSSRPGIPASMTAAKVRRWRASSRRCCGRP